MTWGKLVDKDISIPTHQFHPDSFQWHQSNPETKHFHILLWQQQSFPPSNGRQHQESILRGQEEWSIHVGEVQYQLDVAVHQSHSVSKYKTYIVPKSVKESITQSVSLWIQWINSDSYSNISQCLPVMAEIEISHTLYCINWSIIVYLDTVSTRVVR